MLFNLIGFVSIFILLIPLMVYIYKNMFYNHSIKHEKQYIVPKSSKSRSAVQTKDRRRSPSVTKNTAFEEERKVVNQNISTRKINNPYDLYK